MKKRIFYFLIFLSFSTIFANPGLNLQEDYMLLGEFTLRSEQGVNNPIIDRTINHEGGMKIRIMEFGKSETIGNTNGQWIKILTSTSMWLESGTWVKKNTSFWIFLTEDITVCPVKE